MNVKLKYDPAYAKPTTLGEYESRKRTTPKLDTQPTRRRPAPLPSITITGGQLSDLFFNAEHLNYDRVDRSEINNNVAQDLAEAIQKDAEFFSDLVGNAVSPRALAEDFVHRL